MKSLLKLGLLSLITVVFFTTAQAQLKFWKSEDFVKETRSVSGFDAIDMSSAFEVELTQGDEESLVIEADEDMMEYIITEVVGGTLRMYIKSRDISFRKIKTIKAYISFKMIDEIEWSGVCSITGMNKMKFDDILFDASGATKIELDFTANDVQLELSGASKAYFTGYADEFEVDVSGTSNVAALDFEVKKCDVDASGMGKAKVFVTEELEVDVSGVSSVRYKGNPSVYVETSGHSSVRRY